MEFIPLTKKNYKRKLLEENTNESRKRKKKTRSQRLNFVCDPRLIPRVKQFLENKGRKTSADVEFVADELQQVYPEYRRKKRNVFRMEVSKALKNIQKLSGVMDDEKDGSGGQEENHDFSDDSENYLPYEDTNMVNTSMQDLYKKSGAKQIENLKSESFVEVSRTVKEAIVTSAPASKCISPIRNTNNGRNNRVVSSVKESNQTKLKTENNLSIMKTSSEKRKDGKKKDIPFLESSVKFADIGGAEKTLHDICQLLVHMKHPEVYEQLGVIPPRGFLLHGPPGCGKTLLGHAIAGELGLPFIKIAATEIVSGVSGESEETIRDLFEKAVNCAPCILFIDEIDSVTPKRENAQKEMEKRIVAQLLTCMDELNQKDTTIQVLVIGATNRPDSLDPALRRAGRFDREICMGIPDEAARSRILKVLCRNLKLHSSVDFNLLAKMTPGCVGADLMALTREAAICAINRVFSALQKPAQLGMKTKSSVQELEAMLSEEHLSNEKTMVQTILDKQLSPKLDISPPNCFSRRKLEEALKWLQDQPPLSTEQLQELYIEMIDFQEAVTVVQPSAKREGFATVPDVTWDDIGALQDVREELQLAILAPIRHREKFESLGLTNSTGILLCGPPGCGKTLLAKAIANESGINFISVKGPELLNMYVGESERAVRQCFQRARNSVPCVIFFDELDALCPRRTDSAESGSSARVVNQLLTEMDGLEARKQVFVMGATNRPDIIDRAMLRPGRLDKLLFVGLPTPEDRVDILRTITKNGRKPCLSSDVDLKAIGNDSRCEGFTGADLAALVREASVAALKESLSSFSLKNEEAEKGQEEIKVFNKHFQTGFLKVKASVSLKDQRVYDKIRQTTLMKVTSQDVSQGEKSASISQPPTENLKTAKVDNVPSLEGSFSLKSDEEKTPTPSLLVN
ncbi:nuclear valosin-containing protein-like smid isoform X2 [Tachypleus tridentatus]|uniref:nuclear valosin-containing protein-like smid isoform X2 n=1 Tax=Tachypleus tridentatus TaxID=6853 RepID=UPI003FD1092B